LTALPTQRYTGFSGRLNTAVMFRETIMDRDVGICSNCSLVTGYNKGVSNTSISVGTLTGWFFSGISGSAVANYVNKTGQVSTHNSTTIDIIVPSGVIAQYLTGELLVPIFSGGTITVSRDTYMFNYDTNALNTLATYSLYFNQLLGSGDVVEIYTYPQPNINVNKQVVGLQWPSWETGFVQLVANGLYETRDVDFAVSRNQISGENTDDVLLYDVLPTNTLVTPYSGYWSGGSRMLLAGGWFPPRPQYYENAAITGIVFITGLNKVCTGNPYYPRFGYDLFMNGQKIISGMHYGVVSSGVSGFVVSLSGDKLPPLNIFTLDNINVLDVDDSELTFVPQYSGYQRTRIDVSVDQNLITTITGFGEQIWINGVRMLNGLDYQKTLPCSLITGAFNPPTLTFTVFDSDAGNNAMWNVVPPPNLNYVGASYLTYDANNMIFEIDYIIQVPASYPHGPFIEVWVSGDDNAKYQNQYRYFSGVISSNNVCEFRGPLGEWCYRFALRYRSGNYIGPWAYSDEVCGTF
jgi:hypothetical protein